MFRRLFGSVFGRRVPSDTPRLVDASPEDVNRRVARLLDPKRDGSAPIPDYLGDLPARIELRRWMEGRGWQIREWPTEAGDGSYVYNARFTRGALTWTHSGPTPARALVEGALAAEDSARRSYAEREAERR